VGVFQLFQLGMAGLQQCVAILDAGLVLIKLNGFV